VVRFGGGATWGAYEIHFFDNNIIGLDSSVGVSANRPDYGLELGINCSDSEFYENIITNAKIAGILETGEHMYVHDNHVYGYPIDYISQYGISIPGRANRTYNNRLDTPSVAGILISRWGNTVTGNHVFWNTALVTDYTGKTGIKIDNSGNNLTSLIVQENFIEGVSLVEDITLVGNLPVQCKIKDNITNALSRFDSVYRGKVSVPANATTVSITFKYPMTNYDFMIKTSNNIGSVIHQSTTLTGATFTIATPVNWTGGFIFWELTPLL
jgi:hypothetical protein